MATMLAKFTIKSGCEQAYEDIQSWLYDQTHANEPTILRYEFFRGQAEREYIGLLSFDDFRTFMVHQTSDYHETFSAKFRDLVEDSSFDWIDPLPAAANLPATKAQDLPADASELARQYEKMLGINIPKWWPSPEK